MDASRVPSERIARVRCLGVDTELTRDSRCRVEVEVEWSDGSVFRGEASASGTPEGQVQAGAQAAVQAAEDATGGTLGLNLRGAKAIRAFDRHLVVVALKGTSPDKPYDLIGSAAAPEGNLAHGAVLAVLNGTNRVLGKYVNRPDSSSDPGSGRSAP